MTTPELIEKFQKEHYPDKSYSEVSLIVNAPFEMFKQVMLTGDLEEVRLQYLFVARVSAARVMKHLRSIYKNRDRITEKNFDKYNSMLIKYISDNPKKFKKYESKINQIIQ